MTERKTYTIKFRDGSTEEVSAHTLQLQGTALAFLEKDPVTNAQGQETASVILLVNLETVRYCRLARD